MGGLLLMLGAVKLYMKLSARCYIHVRAKWELKAEIPLWHYAMLHQWAAGNQPRVLCTYQRADKSTWSQYDPDLNYVLAGKLIEQTNTCPVCGFVRHKWTKVTV